MMLDYYGLGKGFPGAPVPDGLPTVDKAARLEDAIYQDIRQAIPEFRPDVRFVPYIQMHEYEGLLFSDPTAFAEAIYQPDLAQPFQGIHDEFDTPEDINDSPNSAPSKRIATHYPGYRKVLDGTIAAQAIGIEAMRQKCPHFDAWIDRLIALAQ